MEPETLTDGTDSRPQSKEGPMVVDVTVEPPTPKSERVVATPESATDADDEDDVVDTREVQSGPSTPTGQREREADAEPPDIVTSVV